jgi:ATP-dependent DNA ligase
MGWWNSRLVIGAYDTNGQIQKIGVIHSGISDEMKEDMTNNPNKYLNKVCMIQCMELDSKEHTIRHGFYKGMREDKNAEDCTFEAVFGQKQ